MTPTAIKEGSTYSDGKSGVRRVYRVKDGVVFYEMLSGGMNRHTENLGLSRDGFMKFRCSLKSFATWAKEEVELVIVEDAPR